MRIISSSAGSVTVVSSVVVVVPVSVTVAAELSVVTTAELVSGSKVHEISSMSFSEQPQSIAVHKISAENSFFIKNSP
ncbi:MAG: hypothetical protein K2K44_02755 [Oscillospiraceae bacterium]|nr:hypothetical protein [Oscillospiraceae bacterium]